MLLIIFSVVLSISMGVVFLLKKKAKDKHYRLENLEYIMSEAIKKGDYELEMDCLEAIKNLTQ